MDQLINNVTQTEATKPVRFALSLHKRLRVAAARRGTTIQAICAEAAVEYLRRGGTANTSTPPSAAAN